ncbi:MAG: 2-oxoacid:acceptor oxidoreductase family protein [Kouleothrix sp.]|jgi:2-oxoglutarate ferredoxin oxidoreductase subunit gamma|nr:2-oxoacid:acceptor oxidoreductase family protein [Kouleothrix sp.]
MYNDVIFSGFGGQGVLFTGQLLAYAAMDAGLHVTWIPSYGPEMRGGTAHCTVVVSDSPIGSPLVRRPRNVVAFNNPSFEKYLPQLAPDGTLVYNSSLITPSSARTDIQLVAVPANDLAAELGEARLLNMVLLGALLARAPILPLATLERALATHTAERHRALLAPNLQALRRAYEYAGGC